MQGLGAAMSKRVTAINRHIEVLRQRLNRPVSVKFRLGLNAQEKQVNVFCQTVTFLLPMKEGVPASVFRSHGVLSLSPFILLCSCSTTLFCPCARASTGTAAAASRAPRTLPA